MRLLSAFVAFAYSSSALADPPSLLGLNVSLERTRVWTSSAGVEYVGWPAEDAEALLEVVERRVPRLLGVIKDQDTLIALRREQAEIRGAMIAETATIAAEWKGLAESWKAAATISQPTILDRLLALWPLWLVVGIVAGAVGTKALLDGRPTQ